VSWVESNLGESCELYQPQTITTKDLIEDGKYLVYGANGVIGKYDKYNHEEPQLLVTCRGATCGSVNISSPFSWINGNAMVVKPKHKEISVRYLEYFFRGAVDLTKAITGAAQPQITRQSLSPIGFKYPQLITQQKIVAKLDAIFAEIDKATAAAEANAKNAEALFQSYLTEIFERGGDGWVEASLQELLDKKWIISHLDGNHGSDYPRKEEFINSGIPYISANCLDGDLLNMDRCKYLSKERASSLRKGLAKNEDVLFAHNATVGPVAILQTKEKVVILGTSLTYYRCDKQYIEPEYLANYMRSAKFKNQYLLIMRQSTRNQIPITKQREFFHIIPPLKVQRELLGKFNVLLEMKFKYESSLINKIKSLSALKNSILQQAFNGELVKD